MTPQQQRVWDAAYGAAFAQNTPRLEENSTPEWWAMAANRARFIADRAAASLIETETEQCHI